MEANAKKPKAKAPRYTKRGRDKKPSGGAPDPVNRKEHQNRREHHADHAESDHDARLRLHMRGHL